MVLLLANGWKTGIMIAAMIVIFYLFLIKPQSDRTKKEKEWRNQLKAGDELMTAGGIHVKLISHDGVNAQVEVAKDTRIKVQLSSLMAIPERKRK